MNKIISILKNKYFLFLLMMFSLFAISTFYIVYFLIKLNNVETVLRFLAIMFLLLFCFFLGLKTYKTISNKKIKLSIIYSIVFLLLFTGQSFIYNTLDKVYSSINNITANTSSYSSSLIVLKSSNIKDIKNLKNKKIGIYSNKESIEGYVIPNEIIKEKKLNSSNEVLKYDNMIEMLEELYAKKIDAIFLSSNYPIIFSYNGFKNIEEETLVITSKEKIIKNKVSSIKETTKPFTILLMGVDSTLESIKSGSAFNGDALILMTFNPKTLSATMLSIPRDTYVPITCFKNQKENKITHAAWYGEECMINTIENFTKIDIDYYVKINFKGLVKLVDNLGGINVDVPYSLCEQNSSRNWGNDTVFVEKGYRKLNGEQALALSRNRHKPNDGSDIGVEMKKYCPTYSEGKRDDIERGKNQQKVIDGILNGLKNIKKIDELYSLLDVMSESFETNMTTNQILSLYDVAKNMLLSKSNLSFNSLYLSGYDTLIWDDSFKDQLYNYYYYRQSLKDIVKEMNINLEKEAPELIKKINFSINNFYEKPVIGQGPYNETRINLLPNFVGKNISTLNNWKNSNKVNVMINYVDVKTLIEDNIIISQNIPFGSVVNNIRRDLEISVGKYIESTPKPTTDIIPDFSTYSLEEVYSWKENNSSIDITIKIIKTDEPNYDPNRAGKFYSQSIEPKVDISEIDKITITFFEKEKEL